MTFKTENGKWFNPIIPEGTNVKIQLRYFDNSTSIMEIPVKEDMLRNFDRIGWSISLLQLRKYIPAHVMSYTTLD